MLECMCGNVLCGRTDSKLPFFTEAGSFWTNSTTELLASGGEKGSQGRLRDRCNGEGYESVALIPLRADDAMVGLLQINDHRRGQFTPEMIRFFEGLSASIGIAFARRRGEAVLAASEETIRHLFNNAEVGMFRCRLDGSESLDMNDKCLAILGRTRGDVIGKPSSVLWADPKKREAMVETVKAKGRVDGWECSFLRKNGSIVECIASMRLSPEQGILEGSAMDISALKRAEAKIRMFSHQLIAVREQERRRVSAGLHHDLGSLTVGISAGLDAVVGDIQCGKTQEAVRMLKRTRKLFDQSVSRLKKTAIGLRPPELDVVGLNGALRRHFAQVAEARNIHIHFRDSVGRRRVPPAMATIVFRIIQEAVTNAVRHGRAKNVDVRLSAAKGKLLLVVRNDGIVFRKPVGNRKGLSHMGLRMMEEMATFAGGAFKITHGRAKGATVQVRLPFGTAVPGGDKGKKR